MRGLLAYWRLEGKQTLSFSMSDALVKGLLWEVKQGAGGGSVKVFWNGESRDEFRHSSLYGLF